MKPPGTDPQSRIDELEARLAQQDHALLELSDEVYKQQQQLAQLDFKLRQLSDRLDSLSREGAGPAPGLEVPPHY